MDQGKTDPPLRRSQDRVFRPRAPRARKDEGQDHPRRRQPRKRTGRRSQVRDQHPEQTARRGIQPLRDVEVAERHHPRRPRRHGVPRADPARQHPPDRPQLEKADHHRPPRLRRRLPRDRVPRAGSGESRTRLYGRGRRNFPRDGFRLRGVRRGIAGAVQPRRLDPLLRALLLPLRPRHQAGPLVLDQGHHLETVRPDLQTDLRRTLRERVQKTV